MSGSWLASRRGQLTSGQVVTAVAPIAQALADAHARGLVHGRLTAAEVQLTAEGKPVLRGVGELGSGTAEGDIQALAQIGLELLLPDSSGPVRDALHAAESGDAADLAAALLAAARAEPLRAAPAAVPAVAPTRPARRRRRWSAVLVVLLVAALTCTQLVHGGRTTSWAAVLQQLDAQRAAAFTQADAAMLADVYVAGSQVLAEDLKRLQSLTARHQTARGLRHQLSVISATPHGDAVRLEVVAALQAYEVWGPGAARRLVPAGIPSGQRLTLVRTGDGWRIETVLS